MNGRVKHCVNAIKRAELLPAEATRRLTLSRAEAGFQDEAPSRLNVAAFERHRTMTKSALFLRFADLKCAARGTGGPPLLRYT